MFLYALYSLVLRPKICHTNIYLCMTCRYGGVVFVLFLSFMCNCVWSRQQIKDYLLIDSRHYLSNTDGLLLSVYRAWEKLH